MAHYADEGTRLDDRSNGDDDADEEARTPKYARRPRRRGSGLSWGSAVFYVATVASFLTILVLLKIGMFDVGAPDPEPVPEPEPEPVPEPMTFRDDDYVLSPDWDYDAPPTTRVYHWVVSNMDANPDGVYRPMTVINGQFPGELIRANEGDTVSVTVENQGANATAIHWHGLYQNGTNHMDGTPGATQCPIAPGRSFRYEFAVHGQSGTYFYHGHHGADALDGLVGPIVVHARGETGPDGVPQAEQTEQNLAYDSDRVVLVQDWYHDASATLLVQALEPGAESPPLPDGALVNGRNVVDCTRYPARRCDTATTRLSTLDLPTSGRHRLRLVNVGALAWIEVSLDGHHALALTEMDGVDIVPTVERTVLLAPGQRYSVVVSSADGNGDAFWLRARIATHCFGESLASDSPVALAVVRYHNDDDAERMPTTDDDSTPTVVCRDMAVREGNETRYAPVPARPAPVVADHAYSLRLNLEIHDWRLQRGYLNASSYRPNIVSPALLRAVDGLAANDSSFRVDGFFAQDSPFPAQTELTLAHEHATVFDLVVQNLDEGSHPLHLHGHQVIVLGAGHGYFPGYDALGLRPDGHGLVDGLALEHSRLANPVRRDVVAVEGFGWTVVRVVADNPGVWKFHCHMAWHDNAGMAMLLLSRTADLAHYAVPDDHRALCDASPDELLSGAAPSDDVWQ